MNRPSSVYAVIMAGGVGSRFWPRSREKNPKQLLEIVGEGTMIQNTVRRLAGFVEPKNVFVVTNRLQRNAIVRQLPDVPAENIIVEPVGRNTAPCIGLAALFIHRLDPDALMVVLPADHLIADEPEFLRVLGTAATVAQTTGALVTIGIHPTHPETGYGYIQAKERSEAGPEGVYEVKTFAEKPNYATAIKFLESGDFYWNSGMFIWRVDTILAEIHRSLPDLHAQLLNLQPSIGTPLFEQNLETAYGIIRGISIDYGVMEKAEKVFVVKGDFGWNDLGSWDEVARLAPKDENGNTIAGKVIPVKCRNNYVHTADKPVAVVGVEDLIVINTPDAILVCKKGMSQDVKEVVDHLKRKQMNEFL
ncbi:MAG: NTP transferase domain-containing protein [Bacteroidetes bacterium]|nr:MAG: NTP transferase domain-containing protein [Bacteroidota bacterium]